MSLTSTQRTVRFGNQSFNSPSFCTELGRGMCFVMLRSISWNGSTWLGARFQGFGVHNASGMVQLHMPRCFNPILPGNFAKYLLNSVERFLWQPQSASRRKCSFRHRWFAREIQRACRGIKARCGHCRVTRKLNPAIDLVRNRISVWRVSEAVGLAGFYTIFF